MLTPKLKCLKNTNLLCNYLLVLTVMTTCVSCRKHHRGRKHVLQSPKECKEPHNLDTTLNLWRNELQISDPPMETFDEEWQPLSPEPRICELFPKGGKDSSVMERALCPWQWRQNHDDSRSPQIIAEAFCLCKYARANSPAYCMPIRHEVPILKRTHCDPITKTWHYVKATQSITIACHTVYAKHAKASPLSNHYRVTSTEI